MLFECPVFPVFTQYGFKPNRVIMGRVLLIPQACPTFTPNDGVFMGRPFLEIPPKLKDIDWNYYRKVLAVYFSNYHAKDGGGSSDGGGHWNNKNFVDFVP